MFLFIGDGMGTAQIQSARFYQGTATNNGAVIEAELSFTQFPEVGSVTTYDSTSFCPDSASTATSIATGHKTESGVINMCPWTRDVPYETIAEKLHKQRGYKVGVISSVNIDHATPAAFYAHQNSRKNYYDIGVELANSGFEYFAGGEFQKVNGDGTVPNNHEVAAQAGYNVVTTQAGAAALTAGAGKTLIIAENLADGKAMNYAMDAAPGEWQLTDYVRKGIELLDNKKGFFLMTESGKIDWACHANDAAASIHDVLEMSNAVQAAVEFYNMHPNETLILVTADHETGGMGIGYKTTNYDTFLTNLTHQKMSYAKFDSTYVEGYIANKTPFEAAMADVKANFGLTLPTDPDAASAGKLLLTDYEVENLRKAYERTLNVGADAMTSHGRPGRKRASRKSTPAAMRQTPSVRVPTRRRGLFVVFCSIIRHLVFVHDREGAQRGFFRMVGLVSVVFAEVGILGDILGSIRLFGRMGAFHQPDAADDEGHTDHHIRQAGHDEIEGAEKNGEEWPQR